LSEGWKLDGVASQMPRLREPEAVVESMRVLRSGVGRCGDRAGRGHHLEYVPTVGELLVDERDRYGVRDAERGDKGEAARP